MISNYLEALIKELENDTEFSWEHCVFRFSTYLVKGELTVFTLEVIADNAWTSYSVLKIELCELLFPESQNGMDKLIFFEKSRTFLYNDLVHYLHQKRRVVAIDNILAELENE